MHQGLQPVWLIASVNNTNYIKYAHYSVQSGLEKSWAIFAKKFTNIIPSNVLQNLKNTKFKIDNS